MQVKNPARQDLSMKTIINTIIETIKFWEEKGMDYKNAGVDIEAGYKSVELMKQKYLEESADSQVLFP